jgi:solute carrier family 35 (UDP-sugar transporter), member A1/2/3
MAFRLDGLLSPKWIALVALVLQNSGLAILMRYTLIFVKPGTDHYLTSTAVLTAEVMKLVISVALTFIVDASGSYKTFMSIIYGEFVGNAGDWIKLMIPSILYTIQNSLQYFSMSRLSAPVFQVLYQMKIITTAIFSVTILARKITGLQWLSVVALTAGVGLVQLSQTKSKDDRQNSIEGLVSVILGCFTSGFAGVYFEMVLKSSKASIWLRNIQLSMIGIVMSVVRTMLCCGLISSVNTSSNS